MKWIIFSVFLISALFMSQAIPTNATNLFDTTLKVTPEYRNSVYNSTQEIKIWTSNASKIEKPNDESKVVLSLISAPDKVDIKINFAMISYMVYGAISGGGDGYILSKNGFQTTYHENDSIALYFHWTILKNLSRPYIEKFLDGDDCYYLGCKVLSDYFISVQLVSHEKIWNETVELGINAQLGSRTQTIDSNLGIKVKHLSGFDFQSSRGLLNTHFLIPTIILFAAIYRRKKR